VIDHFEIKTINFDDCKMFYAKVLPPLNIELKWADESAAGFGLCNNSKVGFMIEKFESSISSHIAFSADSKEAVINFYNTGIENGFLCNGQPGLRRNYASIYYAAFLFDPDGNNVEAVAYL